MDAKFIIHLVAKYLDPNLAVVAKKHAQPKPNEDPLVFYLGIKMHRLGEQVSFAGPIDMSDPKKCYSEYPFSVFQPNFQKRFEDRKMPYLVLIDLFNDATGIRTCLISGAKPQKKS